MTVYQPAQFLIVLAIASRPAMAPEPFIGEGGVRIPPGATRSVDFTVAGSAGPTHLLDLVARLDSVHPAGSSHFLRLVLNGRLIQACKTRQACRLTNRPLVSPVAPGLAASWCEGGVWRVLFAPDFSSGVTSAYYVGDPHRLVLDVSDLILAGATNRLEISNVATAATARAAGTAADLVVARAVLRSEAGPSPLLETPASVESDLPRKRDPDFSAEVRPGGGLRVVVEGRPFEIGTSISYPNAGFNHLTAGVGPGQDAQPLWRVSLQPPERPNAVQAEGPDYRLERRIQVTTRRVEVTDQITNRHPNAKLGLVVSHEVKLDEKEAAVRLAGIPNPEINEYHSAGNPTVHVALGHRGLGLVCEDDVFRNQALLFCNAHARSAGMRTEMLCLPAGGAYTLRWSIYPVGSGSYDDFINLVREDWGANAQVDGAWTFFAPDDILRASAEQIQGPFSRLGIKYACSYGGWVDPKRDGKRIGFGTEVMAPYWADYRLRVRDAAAKIRQAVPGCRVLVYFDTQRDSSADAPERFADSLLVDAYGQPLSTDWSGLFTRAWSMLATLENSFGRAILQVAAAYRSEIGADGLYWDEIEAVDYGRPQIAYGVVDGYSCILNPVTHAIDREVGLPALLGAPLRAEVIDRVRNAGGVVMGNGPARTRALQDERIPRMVEIQHNDYWAHEGDLASPLAYPGSRTDFGAWIDAVRQAKLLVGQRYDYEHEVSRFVFPFTPVELHAGLLIGEERIVSVTSGSLGWSDDTSLVQCRHFDRRGRLTGRLFPTIVGREARTRVALDEGEMAVLERLPLALAETRDAVTIEDARYSPEDVRFVILDGGATRVALRGPFLGTESTRSCSVSTDGRLARLDKERDGSLVIQVPSERPVRVVVRPMESTQRPQGR